MKIDNNQNMEALTHTLVLCANVLIFINGKFLVMKRSVDKRYAPGVVVPFGGKLDLNEDPYGAAKREIQEETGLQIKNLQLKVVVTEVHHNPQMMGNWLVFYFLANAEDPVVSSTSEGDALFLSEDELKSENLFPAFKEILPYMLEKSERIAFAKFTYDINNIINESVIYT